MHSKVFITGLSLVTSLLLTVSNTIHAAVNGTVYLDLPTNGNTLNSYGIKDSNEKGISGITVRLNGELGEETVTTNAQGEWQSNSTLGNKIRVFFDDIPAWLNTSPVNTDSNTQVQFINDGDVANLGLYNPSDYSDTTNPGYVTNVQQNGISNGSTRPSIQSVNYIANGLNQDFSNYQNSQGTGPSATTDTTIQQTGAVWGKAFHKESRYLYAASVLQRHIGLAQSPADIFVVDYSTTPSQFLGSFSLQGITPTNGGNPIDLGSVCRATDCATDTGNTGIAADYTLSTTPTAPNIDLDAFSKVGKISYGDIDIHQATDTLWLVNLNQRALISIDINSTFANLPSSNVNQYLIDSMPNAPSCTGGELRPWALSFHQSKGYLGAICDAETSQQRDNLEAYVLSFDPNNPNIGFDTAINFPLDYQRTSANSGDATWNPWDNDTQQSSSFYWKIHPQPVLSDIEFDENNTMYLSFIDRFSAQQGYANYWPVSGTTNAGERARGLGELFRACYNNGNYELEGTGSCTQSHTTEDEFFYDNPGDGEIDGAEGALALLKGRGQLLAAMLDPHPQAAGLLNNSNYWYTHGTMTYNTQNGEIENWYSIIFSNHNGYNGKGTAIGDIELLTAAPPLEIGNRVWLDSNSDGIQDANEPPLANVNITLNCANQQATTQTDAQGHYLFKDATADIATWTDSKIPRYTDCTLSIATNDAALAQRTATTVNTNVANRLNNDAQRDNNQLVISFNSGRSGYHQHHYDFGIAPHIDLALSKTVDVSNAEPGQTVTYTLSVNNTGPDSATNVQVTDQLPPQVNYLHDTSNGAYDPATGIWTIGEIASNSHTSIQISVSPK